MIIFRDPVDGLHKEWFKKDPDLVLLRATITASRVAFLSCSWKVSFHELGIVREGSDELTLYTARSKAMDAYIKVVENYDHYLYIKMWKDSTHA